MSKAAGKYTEGVGRRKTSVARVRIWAGTKSGTTVNEKDYTEYFPTKEMQAIVHAPFVALEVAKVPAITVKVVGGGIHSQAEAVRMGIARALEKDNKDDRTKLKSEGFLSRDPRAKERRKFGLKKARKSPQWSKR